MVRLSFPGHGSDATGAVTKQLKRSSRGYQASLLLLICGCEVFTFQPNTSNLESKVAMNETA